MDHLIPIDKYILDPDKPVQIVGASEFIPGITPMGSKVLLDVQGQVKSSGFYNLMQNNDLVYAMAFNYDRKESDLSLTDVSTLGENSGYKVWTDPDESDFTQLIESERQGRQLWRWCLIFALLFIAFEIALIRLWKA